MLSGPILCADDEPYNLGILRMALKDHHPLVFARSGEETLNAVTKHHPVLILLDVQMPDMDGYEVCRRLKANPSTQDIPVIFISALDEVLDKVKAFAVGGTDYITKPFSEEEVFARVENNLTIGRLQKQLTEQNARLQQEICDRLKAQAALTRSEAKFRHLFESAPVGIFRARIQDGLLLEANQCFIQMLGYNHPLDVLNQKCTTDFYKILSNQQQMWAKLEHQGIRNFKMQFCKLDGSKIEVLLWARMNVEEDYLDGVVISLEKD